MASMSGIRASANDFFTNKVPVGTSIAANWVKANPRLSGITAFGVAGLAGLAIAAKVNYGSVSDGAKAMRVKFAKFWNPMIDWMKINVDDSSQGK